MQRPVARRTGDGGAVHRRTSPLRRPAGVTAASLVDSPARRRHCGGRKRRRGGREPGAAIRVCPSPYTAIQVRLSSVRARAHGRSSRSGCHAPLGWLSVLPWTAQLFACPLEDQAAWQAPHGQITGYHRQQLPAGTAAVYLVYFLTILCGRLLHLS